ncbi:hypothetical protein SDC9_66565 [bioreactor metagenome]|uniref:DUF4412 domain-containing protein n=1 Tax=bioreactor metagenome TaxID=1076179 RepID=A0A644XV92_9ZZZZ
MGLKHNQHFMKPISFLFSICILIIVLSEVSCSAQKAPKEFEGMIVYEVKSVSDDSKLLNRLNHVSGNKMIFYYKDGNFKKENYLNGKLLMTSLYLAETNMLYHYFAQPDSIVYNSADLANYSVDSIFTSAGQQTILGYNCNYVYIKLSNDTLPWMNYEIESWGSKDVFIKENRFENFKDGAKNLIVEQLKSLSLKTVMKNSRSTTTMTATEIKRKKLNDLIFTYDETLPMVEYNP